MVQNVVCRCDIFNSGVYLGLCFAV